MREKYQMYIEELEKHNKVLKNNFYKIEMFYNLPITEEMVKDLVDENVEILDSIAYRFAKFQDTLGKTLKLWFALKGESVDNLTIIDVINLAEKMDFSINKKIWWETRNLRNRFSHEYEKEYAKIAIALNDIYEFYPKLEKILNELKKRSNFESISRS